MKSQEEIGHIRLKLPFQLTKDTDLLQFQTLQSMTRQQVEHQNKKLQEIVKDPKLRQLLASISDLSLPELEPFLEVETPIMSKGQFKQPKVGNDEERRIYKFLKGLDSSKNTCQKYLFGARVLDNSDLTISGSVKRLKKNILERMKNIEHLVVYYSTFYPTLLFYYSEGKTKHLRNLKQMLAEVPALKSKGRIFDDIFGRLYQRVDSRYYSLAQFGVEKSKDVKLPVTAKELFRDSEEFNVMFYFMRGENKQLNFIIFDRKLRHYEFDSTYIIKHKRKNLNQFEEFERFYNEVLGETKNEDTNDLLDREEAESDDEDDRPRFQSKSFGCIKSLVDDLLKKNLSEMNERIEELLQSIKEEAEKDSASDTMLKLTEQVEELEQNKTNFELVRDEVKKDIEIGSKQSYVIGLKKLIMAQKQMESKLPIIGKKMKIFQMLRKQNLLIIEGETGSGKSTQFPQLLCQYYKLFDNPDAKPVLVTQPRRLATRSLAERVARQMGEYVGEFVDYVASAGKTANPQAKIIFKLDRLVLDELTEDPLLSKYSCLVIDEAHERTISIDVIIGLITNLLKRRQDFKVIVTSASMDIQLFENYFRTKTLKVSGRMFPVTIYYKDYANFREGDKFQVARKIERVINEQILFDENTMREQFRGHCHLLCFCSGVQQITQLVRIFEKKLNKKYFTVLPLHGKVSPADQRRVFEYTSKHKFIFASRIAETAITIDGVRIVIDPGQDIEMIYDQRHKISSMKLVDISQSSAKQRAGRSGRTAEGYCFRLYSEENFKQRKVCKVPEMENSSLETVVLRLKSLKISNVITFPYISKPSAQGLRNSLELLTIIGALQQTPERTSRITKIGQLLVRIPIDPFLSRAIVEAIIYEHLFNSSKASQLFKELTAKDRQQLKSRGLVFSVTIILSLLINFSNLFFVRKEDRENAEGVKFFQFSDEEGDFFFLDNIYRKYRMLKTSPSKKQGKSFNSELSEWMRKNFLNFKTLRQSEDLVDEISKIISVFKINEDYFSQEIKKASIKISKCKSFREIVLSCLISSFSSNLCKFSGNPHIGYTIVNQRRPMQIYGTSNLSLLGIEADWIISYDLYTNDLGRLYCKVAHAISYEFIEDHTDEFIKQKFKIKQIQERNPFYEQIKYNLPTAVLGRIRYQFSKGQRDEELQFLRQTFPMINEETNQISFFILTDQEADQAVIIKEAKQFTLKASSHLVQKLKSYVDSTIQSVFQNFKHNYIGNIYVYLKDGFEVDSIEFDRREYTIEVVSIDFIIDYLTELCSEYDKREVYSVDSKDKVLEKFIEIKEAYAFKRVIFCLDKEEDKEELTVVIVRLKDQVQNSHLIIDYTIKMVDQRKKVPRSKINLSFFAGTSSTSTLFLEYKTVNSINPAEEMREMLVQAIEKLKQEREPRPRTQLEKKTDYLKIDPFKLRLSKKRNGINFFQGNCDEIEMKEYLLQLMKAGYLGFNFIFPHFITSFRDPDSIKAAKTNEEWRKQIALALRDNDIDSNQLAINIRGNYYYRKNEDVGQLQKKFRVNMTAEIIGLSNNDMKKLSKEIDGKRGVIGCQKVHVRANYDQVIAIPSKKIFQSLEEEYETNLMYFKEEFPMLSFSTFFKKLRNSQKVMIIAYSPNRDDFVRPQRILSNLYLPKQIKLQSHQYNYLSKTKYGSSLLESLEQIYNYKVSFDFDRYSKFIKVYCDDSLMNEIQLKLKEAIAQFHYYCQKISYRGKNLKKVLQILNLEEIQHKGNVFHEILFQTREIEITSNTSIFENIKNKILKLSNSEKGECQICAQTMKNPYKLINCQCSFCWHCIALAIRQFFSSPNLVYSCPGYRCLELHTPININDFKTLLSVEEFQKLCDLKIRSFFQTNRNGNDIMLCRFCQNLLDKREVDKNHLNCQICGRSWCMICLQDHSNDYTCQDWKKRNDIDQRQLENLGIKSCPQCMTGIQKNGGCNHMTCTKCQAHICWKCLSVFKTAKECYDHLSNEGGIYDDGYRQE